MLIEIIDIEERKNQFKLFEFLETSIDGRGRISS